MDLFGYDRALIRERVVEFASGVLSPAIWSGYVRAGSPMCVAASEAGARAIERACDYVADGGRLFVDSGAFVYRDRPGDMPWRKVLEVYSRIASAAQVPVLFVLPDVVGDQDASLDRLRLWGPDIQKVIAGHHGLLPVQLGRLSPPDFVREALSALPHPIDGLALPSHAAAFPPSLLDSLLDLPAAVPRRVHFLGIGKRTRGLEGRLVRLGAVWPDAKVSCDACLHRAAVGVGRPITETRREILGASWDCFLGEWDETEDDEAVGLGDARLACLLADFGEEELEDLVCSSWGVMATVQARSVLHQQEEGPRATAEAIFQYALRPGRSMLSESSCYAESL